ncbi:alcohol dehydrogenase [Penicillium vulpinum]|uniref:alcohol dehydrogenase n=1 Tax=Penicillium vulpinum TaxID=29845 RepID=A0A1V6RXZ9_9EURO|nr:alcohol dehydrogenase [Penicillium vulpinum]KAJ5951519.1 alcohol dehydrogenase [Penicillium vulpinum]OQE06625.1 hypothetical protein PENVUL_c017G03254 [Penicillium vulpinum]
MQDLSRTSKAAILVQEDGGKFHFDTRQVPLPTLKSDEILVRVSCTGICGTDMGLAAGALGPTADILGHEGVGYVEKLGDDVSSTEVQINDRIGIMWIRDVCGKCFMCRTPNEEVRCEKSVRSGLHCDGSFAEYATVPSSYIMRIPKTITVPDEHIAPILCGGVTAYKAVKVGGGEVGAWIAILGAGGGIGALAIQYAKAMGYQVIALDATNLKRDYCLQAGADAYIDVTRDGKDVQEDVFSLTEGRGAPSVLVVAGSVDAYKTALDIIGPLGTLVCVGIPFPHLRVPFHPLLFIDKGIRMIGSCVGTRDDVLDAIDFVQRGLVTPVVNVQRLEDLNEISANFGKVSGKPVIMM